MKNKSTNSPIKMTYVLWLIIIFILFSGCRKEITLSTTVSEGYCEWGIPKQSPKLLGPMDYNAGYTGIIFPVRKNEKLIVKGNFPHSRYASFMLYDQSLMPIDKLTDLEIVPTEGLNPFLPGTERNQEQLGEFEIQVLMEPLPQEQRAPNTLYAGLGSDGKPNQRALLAYRVYLPDKGYGQKDNHPLALFGGVKPPEFKLIDENGNSYCPPKRSYRINLLKLILAYLKTNQPSLSNPLKVVGEAQNPLLWVNLGSEQSGEVSSSSYVPNQDTAYIASSVSNKFGELLVLRWFAPKTPEQTYFGKPFPVKYDLRYWSITFNYLNPKQPFGVYSEPGKTITDIDIPCLPDGSRQIIIGLGGIPKPDFVPQEQWLSVKHSEGILIMRNILIIPGYAGDLRKMPPGKITPENDRFTPGGVYCTIEEFANNPDIGLTREKLMKNLNR